MIRKIQILGTGCSSTEVIAQRVETAARRLGIEFDIEHVTDVRRIMCFAPRLTPALCIDGDIRVAGETPTVQELMGMLDTPTHHRALSVSDRIHSEAKNTDRPKRIL